jgi:glycosyltransferase involved in cell wall biosynthesis
MNAENELISVIITAYNAEKTLEKAIKAVLGQTYKNIELIIVNDCSTDNTLKVAEQYLSDKVRVIDNSINSGTYFCKNYGMKVSRGKYITFHDADDWCKNNHIEFLYDSYIKLKDTNYWKGTVLDHEKNRVKIASCCYQLFSENKKIETEEANIRTIQHGLYSGKKSSNSALITMFFEKKLLEEVGYFDSARVSADMEFFLRVGIVYGSQPYWTPLERATYVYHRTSNTLTLSPKTGMRSKGRVDYQESYKAWHEKCVEISSKPYMPFPMPEKRPFEVDDPSGLILTENKTLESFSEIYKAPPKISIIMQSFLEDYPYSRSEPERKFIRAVYSVIGQTNPNWELVIVADGCSITERLYNEHFKSYENILFEKIDKPDCSKMYSKKDGNVTFRGTPRKKGVEMASGDWICYLDSDDIFTRDAIEGITKIISAKENLEKRYIFNQARIENYSFNEDKLFYAGEEHLISGLPSRWKATSLKDRGNIIKSTSTLIHKRGYPGHSWGDSSESGVSEDNVFINKIIKEKDNLKFCVIVNLGYYVRCHLKEAWDH